MENIAYVSETHQNKDIDVEAAEKQTPGHSRCGSTASDFLYEKKERKFSLISLSSLDSLIGRISRGRWNRHSLTLRTPQGQDKGDRGEWSNPREFLLSCVAMSVGLGNIWRFPFIAYENGGGAFLLPYLFVLMFIGKPLYYMEICLGQFCGASNVKVWSMCPALKGLGYGQLIATACVLSYLCFVMAITCFYFVHCFESILPWTVCGDWADGNCQPVNSPSAFGTGKLGQNESLVTSSEQYLYKNVLHVLDTDVGIDEGIGLPNLYLVMCMFVVWLF